MEVENTFRYKWYLNLENVNNLFKQDEFSHENFKEILTQYITLTEKALDEIKNLENVNKDLEASNWGLDCAKLFMTRLVEYGQPHLSNENIIEMLNDIKNSKQ